MWGFNITNENSWHYYDIIMSYCYKSTTISGDVCLGSWVIGPRRQQIERK